MSQPNAATPDGAPRTKLKINVVSRQASVTDGGSASAGPGSTVSAATPGAPPLSAKTLIKLKAAKAPTLPPITTRAPAAPAALASPTLVSAKTKAGRQTKPTKKVVEASKRGFDGLDDDDSDQPIKKIKLRQNTLRPGTTVRIKHAGRPIVRPLGEGYDSEASDREDDPVIEQQFILRMPPGEHCNHVRKAIEENRFDPRAPERRLADISLKFFEESSRRAVMTVKGQPFAAVMVDLPTITETMKTWDRKSFLKSADVCQMLLVFAPVSSEEEARTAPPPLAVEPGNKWPHGLTPPMHDCVKRRFAKTISRKEIEDKEAEVERLLEEDRKALKTEWRWYDPTQTGKSKAMADATFEEDAEGEPDDAFTPAPNAGEDDDMYNEELQNELENELQNAFEEEMAVTPDGTQLEGATPMTMAAETPAPTAAQGESESEESEEDEESDEDDDGEGDDDDEESDEEISEEQQSLRATKEIIADLRRQRTLKEAERDRANLGIMKIRCENQIRSITQEIKNKLRSIGIEDEEEFDEA